MSSLPEFALLRTFRAVFDGTKYNHRNASLGNLVATQLYEDLVSLGLSKALTNRVHRHQCVVNVKNLPTGKVFRRGDGTFGELVPRETALTESGLLVARGPIANVQIGAETKILAKAMIKQIDRVIGDLQRQVEEFRKAGGNPITVAFVGINSALSYTSYEGERIFSTDGTGRYRHPAQEAAEAETRLLTLAKHVFFDFQILRFRATNVPPFPFEWVDYEITQREYAAVLVRISREYDKRFA